MITLPTWIVIIGIVFVVDYLQSSIRAFVIEYKEHKYRFAPRCKLCNVRQDMKRVFLRSSGTCSKDCEKEWSYKVSGDKYWMWDWFSSKGFSLRSK